MTKEKKAKVEKELCKACEYCVFVCPTGAIKKSGKSNSKGYDYVVIDKDKCNGCGQCYTMCPDCAIIIYESDD